MSHAVSQASRALVGAALAVVVGVAGVLAASPGSAEDSDLPVNYNFLLGAIAAGTQVDADPPGANDWTCRPTAAHPRPVVLVHGTAGNKNTNWQAYSPLLANNGYCVFALTYGVAPGTRRAGQPARRDDQMKGSARRADDFVTKVLTATGAAKVDLIGHSQGTLMPDTG